jgi:hypothetical protein
MKLACVDWRGPAAARIVADRRFGRVLLCPGSRDREAAVDGQDGAGDQARVDEVGNGVGRVGGGGDPAGREAARRGLKLSLTLLVGRKRPPGRVDDPGETALTRTGASSAASGGTIRSMAPLTAANVTLPGIAGVPGPCSVAVTG